ncbi:hypothetical protein [Nocardioides solisilvae]|uniref:hypothetical protein n=1 Tax=Nocardioides solisilvae TaxID=1542435 RepID=UPI000D749B24|nr:hypothetical protein [Nocardioides solisilvae]
MRTSLSRSLLLLVASTALAAGAVAPGPAGATRPAGAGQDDARAAAFLEPRDLPRGPDAAVPHVEGSTFVDGARRVELDAGRVGLLGRSGTAFVLRTSRDDGSRARVVRLLPDDGTEVLLRGRDSESVRLSTDGRRLVQARATSRGGAPTTRVSAWDARTGALVHRHRLPGYVDLLDSTRRRALLSTEGLTFRLDLATGRRTTLVARRAGAADLAAGRLATYTGDPYQGGCTVVSTLAEPRRALWRSCTERVDDFSPDGRHMTTIDLLADGIGPGSVWLRTTRGRQLAQWRTGWFGTTGWEGPATVLLEVNGRRSSALVRCTPDACDNATDPGPVPQLRRGA